MTDKIQRADVFNQLEEMILSLHPAVEKRGGARGGFSEFVYNSTPFVMLKERKNFVGVYMCEPNHMNERQEKLATPFSRGKGCIRVKTSAIAMPHLRGVGHCDGGTGCFC